MEDNRLGRSSSDSMGTCVQAASVVWVHNRQFTQKCCITISHLREGVAAMLALRSRHTSVFSGHVWFSRLHLHPDQALSLQCPDLWGDRAMCVQVLVRSCDHTWQIQVLRISGIYSGIRGSRML